MKKAGLILLLIAALTVSGCGGSKAGPAAEPAAVSTQAPTATPEPTEAPTPEPTEEPTPEPTEEPEDELSPDFLEAMNSIEKFYDDYYALMKKYMANPMDMSILMEYTKMMGQAEEMQEKLDAWESADMNLAETQYYLGVVMRVEQKMLEILQ